MRPDLTQLEAEITPLLTVHGVELVALEWFQGPGHGILRVTIDRPQGDPRDPDPDKSVSLVQVTQVTRDVSTALDALDLIESAYVLEVGSPGTERPLQRRADYDRFAGLRARIETRSGEGRSSVIGALAGTRDADERAGGFVVRVETAPGVEREVTARSVVRAKLQQLPPPRKDKPGKGPSRRQERLAARERARAVNAARHAPGNGASAAVPDNHQPHPNALSSADATSAASDTARNGKR